MLPAGKFPSTAFAFPLMHLAAFDFFRRRNQRCVFNAIVEDHLCPFPCTLFASFVVRNGSLVTYLRLEDKAISLHSPCEHFVPPYPANSCYKCTSPPVHMNCYDFP